MSRELVLRRWLAGHARHRGGRVALRDEHGSLDYAALTDLVARVAGGLAARGVRPGDRVLTAMEPSVAHAVVFLGILEAGAIGAPLNTRLSGAEAQQYERELEPRLVVVDDAHDRLRRDLAADAVTLDEGAAAERLGPLLGPSFGAPLREDQPAAIFPTGGTTGRPKGAVIDHRALVLWCDSMGWNGGRSRDDVELSFSPFHHVTLIAGLTASLWAGASVVVQRRFDPDAALEAIGRHGVTRLLGAPTMFTAMRQSPGFRGAPRERITGLTFGSMAASPQFCDDLIEDYPNAAFRAGYGATEFGPVTVVTDADFRQRRYEGAGWPVAGCHVRVCDSRGRELPPGEVGEIEVTSPWQTAGYWGRPEETAATYLEDGFIRLGDLGYLAASGELVIAGRLKEMIITGGENVFPVEVENVLSADPSVGAAAVFGVPDPVWGERVAAAIVPRDGTPVDAEGLRERARGRLAGYKLPKDVHVVDQLPLTANNKVDRAALVARFSSRDG